MDKKTAKNVCFVLFAITSLLFFTSKIEELKWTTMAVLEAMKLEWTASQSAINTSNIYSLLSPIFFIAVIIFLVGWLYYRKI